jgi:hypothetical protein
MRSSHCRLRATRATGRGLAARKTKSVPQRIWFASLCLSCLRTRLRRRYRTAVKTHAADEQNRDAPLFIRERINSHHPSNLPFAIRLRTRIRAGHIEMQVNVVRGTIRREIKPVTRHVYSRTDFFGNVCGRIVGLQMGPQGHFRSARPAALLAYRGNCLDSRLNESRIKSAHTPPLKRFHPGILSSELRLRSQDPHSSESNRTPT